MAFVAPHRMCGGRLRAPSRPRDAQHHNGPYIRPLPPIIYIPYPYPPTPRPLPPPTPIPIRTPNQMEHATALAHIEVVGDKGDALLVETVPTHFPTLKGCLQAAFAGLHLAGAPASHEWEGFLLAALEWTRQLAAQPGGISVLQGVLRLAKPAVLSKGNLEASLAHAAARYAHTACERHGSRVCLQTNHTAPKARRESTGRTPSCHVRSLVMARKHLSTRALSCEAHRLSLGTVGWRQQIERAAAAARGVQLLARSEARDARFDAHPGRVHGARPFLDCVHSSFAPGAFDVEALGLLQALDERFG